MDQLNTPLEQASFDNTFMFRQDSRDGQGQTQNWLTRNDDAWVPFGGISPTDLHTAPPEFMSNPVNPNAFLDYRSAGIRSECETVPGDSGYGSLYDNTSNYDEPFVAPVPNLDRDIPEFKLSLHPNDSFFSHVESQSGYASTSTANETRYHCDGCNSSVKTKSELKKHQLRHTKPFRCRDRECVGKDRGFASQNDLDRHLRTVHKAHALGKTYFCNLDNCARKTKPWPRADNFRSHLQRVHKLQVSADADLSQYLHQSREPRPIAEDLSGIGTQLQEATGTSGAQQSNPTYSPPNPMRDFPDIETHSGHPHHSLRPAAEVSIEGLLPPNDQHNQPAFVLSNSLESSVVDYHFNNDPAHGQASSDMSTQLQAPRSLPKQEVVSPNLTSHSFGQEAAVKDIDMESDQSSESDAESDSKQITNFPKTGESPAEVLEYLKKLDPNLLKAALSNTTDSETKTEQSTSTAGRSCCDMCEKTFNRPCELRKHMKRHERPYGCTVPRCTKKFGSKNDWKRHERGQHRNTEVWRCDQTGCGYFSYQRSELDTHLRSYHHITDSATIDEKLENLRRGGHCVDDFWCGFCKELVKIDPKKLDNIDQRFNHIDDHFMGRNDAPKMDIVSWCHPEAYFEKALHQQHAMQNKKRKSHQPQANPRPKKQHNSSST